MIEPAPKGIVMRLVLAAVLLLAVSPTAAIAAPGETRDDPVPMGETVQIGDYEITVTGYNPDGTRIVQDYMDNGQEPDEGHVWVLIRATITYTGDGIGSGSEAGEPAYIDTGAVELRSTHCGDATTWRLNGKVDDVDLFPGGTVELIYCAEVTPTQASELVMYLKSDMGVPVFFALEPGPFATPEASPVS